MPAKPAKILKWSTPMMMACPGGVAIGEVFSSARYIAGPKSFSSVQHGKVSSVIQSLSCQPAAFSKALGAPTLEPRYKGMEAALYQKVWPSVPMLAYWNLVFLLSLYSHIVLCFCWCPRLSFAFLRFARNTRSDHRTSRLPFFFSADLGEPADRHFVALECRVWVCITRHTGRYVLFD